MDPTIYGAGNMHGRPEIIHDQGDQETQIGEPRSGGDAYLLGSAALEMPTLLTGQGTDIPDVQGLYDPQDSAGNWHNQNPCRGVIVVMMMSCKGL